MLRVEALDNGTVTFLNHVGVLWRNIYGLVTHFHVSQLLASGH